MGDTEDVAGGTEDVGGDIEDVAGSSEELAGGTEDVARGNKDVTEGTKDVPEGNTTLTHVSADDICEVDIIARDITTGKVTEDTLEKSTIPKLLLLVKKNEQD